MVKDAAQRIVSVYAQELALGVGKEMRVGDLDEGKRLYGHECRQFR
jgi:hypothetical protein